MSAQGTTLRLVKTISLQETAAAAVATYRRTRAIDDARVAIGCLAVQHGHFLGAWRVETDTTALAQCRICGEGAVIHLDLGVSRQSDGLGQPCPGTLRSAL